MKQALLLISFSFLIIASFSACSDENVTDSSNQINFVIATESLKECTQSNNGEIIFVANEQLDYSCIEGIWNAIDKNGNLIEKIYSNNKQEKIAKTKDLLGECNSLFEEVSVFVTSENVNYTCLNGSWTTLKNKDKFIPPTKNNRDLKDSNFSITDSSLELLSSSEIIYSSSFLISSSSNTIEFSSSLIPSSSNEKSSSSFTYSSSSSVNSSSSFTYSSSSSVNSSSSYLYSSSSSVNSSSSFTYSSSSSIKSSSSTKSSSSISYTHTKLSAILSKSSSSASRKASSKVVRITTIFTGTLEIKAFCSDYDEKIIKDIYAELNEASSTIANAFLSQNRTKIKKEFVELYSGASITQNVISALENNGLQVRITKISGTTITSVYSSNLSSLTCDN